MKNDLLYQIALTLIPQVGAVQARILLDKYGDARNVFQTPRSLLEKTAGIGSVRAGFIKSFKDFGKAEKEMQFIEKNAIRPYFLTDNDYPQRLKHCYDPPTLIYYKGNADLNNQKVVAVIGTRLNTSYGKHLTDNLIAALSQTGALVVSGLAFGIDSLAHEAAIKNGLPTAAVLAHGLDIIYPPQNTALSKKILNNGALLTEFSSNTKPDKHHFPSRNRIVAGLSDAVVVIETGIKGGSIITAELANGYNREVFALPGRTTDAKSAGCNSLIFSNKAALLEDPARILQALAWNDKKDIIPRKPAQKALFADLLPEEAEIMEALNGKTMAHVDELSAQTGFYGGKLASALINLQLKDLLVSLPGNMYKPA